MMFIRSLSGHMDAVVASYSFQGLLKPFEGNVLLHFNDRLRPSQVDADL
jgi:hypothetical protein